MANDETDYTDRPAGPMSASRDLGELPNEPVARAEPAAADAATSTTSTVTPVAGQPGSPRESRDLTDQPAGDLTRRTVSRPMQRPDFGPLDDQYSPVEEQVRPKTREFLRVDNTHGLVEYVPSEFVPRGNGRDAARTHRANRWLRAVPGISALALSLLTIILLVIGIQLALAGNFTFSAAVAYVGVGTSAVGFLLGSIAAITDRGRGSGLTAMIVSVATNPLILTAVLGWASGFVAS